MTGRRRVGAAVAALGLLLASAAYAGTNSSGSRSTPLAGKTVAWVMWGTDPYALAATGSFKKAAQAAGMKVILVDGKNDPVVQAKAINTLIAQHVAGIVWQPSDPASAVAPAKKIRAAGIPLVFDQVSPSPSSHFTAPLVPSEHMAAETKKAGEDAANFVKNTLHQTPAIVDFDLVNVPLCHQQRMVPFVNGVKSVAPDAKIVFWDTVPVTKDGTLAKMENLLQANPNFNIFTGCGGDLIVGGFAGLQNAGRGKADAGVPKTEWVLMIDGTPEQLKYQLDQNASVVETIMQRPADSGRAGLSLLQQLITHKLPLTSSKVAALPPVVVFKKGMSCKQINAVFSQQYSAVYPPLKCPA
jgi:ABC-type sugar transport system substrate-binding protein